MCLCVYTRNIPVLFNESRQISTSIYTIALIGGLFIPLVSSVLEDPSAILAFKCLGVLLCALPIQVLTSAPFLPPYGFSWFTFWS